MNKFHYYLRVMKWLIIFLFLCKIVFGQNGGRKNEKSISANTKDSYKTTGAWTYRKTQVGEIQESELPKLFKWTITPNRKKYREIQEKQRQQRAKYRIRGNEVFHRKKYNF